MFCEYSRGQRKSLYQHRKRKGLLLVSWDFTKWNDWFKKQEKGMQKYMWTEYCNSKTSDARDKYTFRCEFNDAGSVMGTSQVVALSNRAEIPFLWTDGGGKEFDDWHKIPVTEQCSMLSKWKKKEEEMRKQDKVGKERTSLDCCNHIVCMAPAAVPSREDVTNWYFPSARIQEQEKEQTMRIESIAVAPAAKSETQTQFDYFTDRLGTLKWNKITTARADFFLDNDQAPTTVKERKARIAAGKFIIDWNHADEDYEEDEEVFYGLGGGHIVWRDPAKPADRKGYDAAIANIGDEYQRTVDVMRISDGKGMLEALQAYESKTFH